MAVWEKFLEKIKDDLLTFYGENLFSAIVFGSAARGDFRKGSDLDLLIILGKSENSIGKRIDEFMRIDREIIKSQQYAMAKSQGFPHRIEPVILDLEEFQAHPPLLLDLTTDAKILIDKENVFTKEMDLLKRRLQEKGAEKIILGEGRWFWVLKHDIQWGEKVVI